MPYKPPQPPQPRLTSTARKKAILRYELNSEYDNPRLDGLKYPKKGTRTQERRIKKRQNYEYGLYDPYYSGGPTKDKAPQNRRSAPKPKPFTTKARSSALTPKSNSSGNRTGGGGRRAGGTTSQRDAGYVKVGMLVPGGSKKKASSASPPRGASTGGARGSTGISRVGSVGMRGTASGISAQQSSSYRPGAGTKQGGGGSRLRAGKK